MKFLIWILLSELSYGLNLFKGRRYNEESNFHPLICSENWED
ncbi:hypothetical protein D1AOALGA4SA_6729 [Olavius algarvensis Delta 1 endosymbiont]|nr:hypothetical protein D1AOALGA4SA_6729 [Olavius algarvensis Delta 1 endosymbiont]